MSTTNEDPNKIIYPEVDREEPKSVALRGFAAMKAKDPDRLKSLATKGGLAMPNEKRAFALNRELARSAGRKGGEASRGGGRKKFESDE